MTSALPQLKELSANQPLFDQYFEVVDEFCKFLNQEESIEARALPEVQAAMVKDRFDALDEQVQQKKFNNFKNYYNECRTITMKGISLSEKQKCLVAFLKKNGLTIPNADEVFETIDENSFIEVYDNEFTQVYRSADFMKVTSHGFMALEMCEWFDLFERSKDLTKDQVEVVTKILQGSIRNPMFKPIEDHHVREINSDSPKISKAEVMVYCPVFGPDDEVHGILHIFRVQEQRSLDFQVVKN